MTDDADIDLDGVLRILWRRRGLLAGVTGGAMAVCALVLFQVQPLYTSQALVRLNDRESRVVPVPDVTAGLSMEGPTVQSEVEVLRSRALAEAVVDTQALIDDPEFNPTLAPPTLARRAAEALDLSPPTDDAVPARLRTIDAFRDSLSVNALNRSLVIAVAVTATDAHKAARLAEATARAYVDRQIADKVAASRAAADWLAERSNDTRARVAEAEAAVAAYRKAHGLGQASDGTLAAQQRHELNTQLTLARSDRAVAEARLSRLRGADALETAPEVLAAPLIQRLREQEAEVRRRIADLSSRYLDKHPRMIDARAELAGLTAQITAEAAKLADGIVNEVRIARAREDALHADLAKLEAQRSSEGQAALGLHELEREADALRALHQTFLTRHKETTSRLGLHAADAAIVSHAAVPQRPSYPRKGLALAAAAAIGLFLALALAYGVERLDRRLRRPDEAERRLGLPCLGQAPRTRIRDGAPWMMSGIAEEEMRSLRLALSLARPADPPRVVCVTSSRPGEGKSTLSLWLAAEAAAGRRVVIVDADLRRPRLAGLCEVDDTPGLPELLAGEASLDDVLRPGPVSGLTVLPGRPLGGVANDLLAGRPLQDTLNALRERFDMVIVDTPPVLPVADARLIAPHADAVLYAVQWEATPWSVAAEGIARLREGVAPDPRLVLTQVDMKKQNSYGYGGNRRAYATYGAYYGT